MNFEEIANTVIDLLAYSAIIPIVLFIYFYGTRPVKYRQSKYRLVNFLRKNRRRYSNRWRQTQIGKTLMFQTAGWFAYLSFIAASLIWSDWEFGRLPIRAVIYIGIVILFWQLFRNLRHVQKQPMPDEHTHGLNLDFDLEQTQPGPTKERK